MSTSFIATKNTYDAFIDSHKDAYLFILFYSSSSREQENVINTWNDISRKLWNVKGSQFIAIDCSKCKDFCQEKGSFSTPEVFVYDQGSMNKFIYGIDESDIADYIDTVFEGTLVKLNEESNIENYIDNRNSLSLFVIDSPDITDSLPGIVSSVGKEGKKNGAMFLFNASKNVMLRVYNDDNLNYTEYNGPYEEESIKEFITTYLFKKFPIMTSTITSYKSRKHQIFICIYLPNENYLKEARELADQLSNNFFVTYRYLNQKLLINRPSGLSSNQLNVVLYNIHVNKMLYVPLKPVKEMITWIYDAAGFKENWIDIESKTIVKKLVYTFGPAFIAFMGVLLLILGLLYYFRYITNLKKPVVRDESPLLKDDDQKE